MLPNEAILYFPFNKNDSYLGYNEPTAFQNCSVQSGTTMIYILLLHIFPGSYLMSSINVLVKTEDGLPSAGATFASPPETPKHEITLCWRFYEEKLTDGKLFSSDLVKNEDERLFSLYGDALFIFSNWKYSIKTAKFAFFFNFAFLHSPWPPKLWHHVCLRDAFNLKTNMKTSPPPLPLRNL